MPGAQRQGDFNIRGGIIMGGVSSVIINGRPAATPGLGVSPHPCCGAPHCNPLHCFCLTSGGSKSVRVGGSPLLLNGAKDMCGDVRLFGSSNVLAR